MGEVLDAAGLLLGIGAIMYLVILGIVLIFGDD